MVAAGAVGFAGHWGFGVARGVWHMVSRIEEELLRFVQDMEDDE